MGNLKDRIRDELNAARRERDKARTLLLTTTISEIKNKEIEVQHDLTDAEVVAVVQKAIKRRQEASEQMRAGNRIDLAEKEEAEARLLSAYLPAQMGEAEVRALVREAIADGANTMGAVMGRIAPRIKGVFDGREANRIVKAELGA
ncbi:MAG: GatB/YqeY domain-containing protein [Gemmatimonadota bacterium]